MTDVDDWSDPTWDDREPDEPPEEYLIEEAERRGRIHREQAHGGGVCVCPVAEPEYGEAPF